MISGERFGKIRIGDCLATARIRSGRKRLFLILFISAHDNATRFVEIIVFEVDSINCARVQMEKRTITIAARIAIDGSTELNAPPRCL